MLYVQYRTQKCSRVWGGDVSRVQQEWECPLKTYTDVWAVLFYPAVLAAGGGASESSRHLELRCVLAVIRHGDRTPKQKMKVTVTQVRLQGRVTDQPGSDSTACRPPPYRPAGGVFPAAGNALRERARGVSGPRKHCSCCHSSCKEVQAHRVNAG